MGYTKWIMTNGIGSIGETTRVWAKIFVDNLKNDSKAEAFLNTFMLYHMGLKYAKIKADFSDSNLIVSESQECLAMFIFCLICENIDVRRALLLKQKALQIGIEVIHEQTKIISPENVKMTLTELKRNTFDYLNENFI